MLDIKFIQENKDIVQAGAKKKHIDFNVDALIVADNKRKEMINEVESMRAEQNIASEKISQTQDQDIRQKLINEVRGFKEILQSKEEELKIIMQEWQNLMIRVPNIPDMSVPEGASDQDNKEISKWGEISEFQTGFKNHIELMQDLDMVDFERGVKVAGFRGYFLKNEGVTLSVALWRYGMDKLIQKGYQPMMVPSLLNKNSFLGTGYLPQGEEDLYKTQDNNYLAGTSEVGIMGYYMGDTININSLPKKIVGLSPCFRREAGSHGRDTKGLMRVHEFFKLEQVIFCEANHDESVKQHEELLCNAEEIMKGLEIPYRVVVNCGGDLGLGQVKKYDIEAWVPSEDKYRETHSASYFHDFQTRRLNIKYRDQEGILRFVHSLNNTAVATPRLLISLLENHQNADGTIKIPEALQPYMGNKNIISFKN